MKLHFTDRAVARALIEGGGWCIFIYSGSARLVPFEIKLISKEVSRTELEYMNKHLPPPISVLATALLTEFLPEFLVVLYALATSQAREL